MGYDWERLRADCLAAVEALQALDATTLRRLTKSDFGVGDVLQVLAQYPGILRWLNFRATVIRRNLRRFHAAVHQAAGDRPIVFGVDSFPPKSRFARPQPPAL